ncbi:MAG: DUF1573 domain-containing protein [Flavobacteriaceae bacterium]|nr:DUF1573 domain-containing protein [Flavobacteriaceae bacterium]
MKKFLYTILFAGAGMLALTAQEITFNSEVMEYGDVAKGADGNKTFTFKNTGDAPLILKLVKPACGCTVADYPKEPLAPGESGTIKVGYNTNTVGAFNKTIEVHSNAVQNGRKILRIKGRVIEQL